MNEDASKTIKSSQHLLIVLCWHLSAVCLAVFVGPDTAWWVLILLVLFFLAYLRSLSEWVHEASHFNFAASRGANEFWANLLLCPFFFKSINSHRMHHLKHHSCSVHFIESDLETYVFLVRSRWELVKGLLADLLGITTLRIFLMGRRWQIERDHPLISALCLLWALTVHVLIAFALISTGRMEVLISFYVTLFLLYMVISRFRVYGQHAMLLENGTVQLAGSTVSRDMPTAWWSRWWLTSDLMAYHYGHHLNPAKTYLQLKDEYDTVLDENRSLTSYVPLLVGLCRGIRS